MDREQEPLKLAGVVGDPTRFAIYQYLCTSGAERVTAQEIAARFGLHPNVARLHLNKLRDVGLLEAHVEKSGRGGRPGTAYSLADRVLTLHFPPRDYRLLAELLSQALARMGDEGRRVLEEVGRSFGRELAGSRQAGRRRAAGATDAADAAGATDAAGAATGCADATEGAPGESGGPVDLSALPPEALEEVVRALARHGVHAEVVRDGSGAVNLIMRNCGFKEVATHYPELVCQLCESIVRGVVDAHLHVPAVHEEASIPRGDKFCVYVAERG